MKNLASLLATVAITLSQPAFAQAADWQAHFSNMGSLTDEEKFQDAAKEGTAALRELEKLPKSKERNASIEQVLGKISALQQRFESDSNWVWSEYVSRCLLQGKEFVKGTGDAETAPILNGLARAVSMQGRAQEAQTYVVRAKAAADRPRRERLLKAQQAQREQQLKAEQQAAANQMQWDPKNSARIDPPL